MCQIVPEIGPFWYLVSKKFHNHEVIIRLLRLLRCETVKIWKRHWKLMFSESQCCFANISRTEALIFMKFYVVVNYYLVNWTFEFHEHSCLAEQKDRLGTLCIFSFLEFSELVYWVPTGVPTILHQCTDKQTPTMDQPDLLNLISLT